MSSFKDKRTSKLSMASSNRSSTSSLVGPKPELPLYLPSREPIVLGSTAGPEVVITLPKESPPSVTTNFLQSTSTEATSPPSDPYVPPLVIDSSSRSKRSSISAHSIPLSPASKALIDNTLMEKLPSFSRAMLADKVKTATMLVSGMSNLRKLSSPKQESRALNQNKNVLTYAIQYHGSVLPHVIAPVAYITLWTIFWVLIHQLAKWTVFATNPLLISVIGVVLSLLLVFRNNTAYDRYWEGRRLWSSIVTHCRNLSRVIWIMGSSNGDAKIDQEKRGALNLVLAFPIATKYLLRGEYGVEFSDLFHLIAHVPAFNPAEPRFHDKNVPMEILFHLTSYITYDVQGQTAFFTALTGLMDNLTNLERIRTSPIPLIYNIHLKVVVLIYLLALPFQLVNALNYFTIPVVAIASFILIGIEFIAVEIENPFGEDANDLPIDEFIGQVRQEMQQVIESDPKRDPSLWLSPLTAEQIRRRSVTYGSSMRTMPSMRTLPSTRTIQ
ncbi:Bestrophin, RFP-TM, chloride channel-domain-containing protein [Chytridium lagenaria]|nr:Bestrophin, RFP-TM, chloride channel-domain-containing protein [Chytridium lagenaria]